ncbi:uncharacterized protein [Antennarius striatus]|uniref:uncharacterized protein isoform X2 n=1 Tax=Antennarius striatus TaxID=241820 RepID=UPI0035B4CA45
MTSPMFVLYLACLFMRKNAQMTDQSLPVHQDGGIVSAKLGDSITLRCFHKSDMVVIYSWYKQTLSQKLQRISTIYMSTTYTFHSEFTNNPRFTIMNENSHTDLKISDIQVSDSATYHCASSLSDQFEFLAVFTLIVKGSGLNIPVLVHQSVSVTMQPAILMPLNCTVQTGMNDGKHSFYWFNNREESHPGLIYTHGRRNDSCNSKVNKQTCTCVYNMPTENQSSSQSRTCAVASCGQILLKKGAELDSDDSLVLVYFLSGTLAFITIPNIFLAFLVCIFKKRINCKCRDSQVRFLVASMNNAEGSTKEDNLHYATVTLEKTRRTRRQRHNREEECVYSTIQQ